MGGVGIKGPDIGGEPGGVQENIGGDVLLLIIVVICGENICMVFVEVFDVFTVFVVTINCLNEFKPIGVEDKVVASNGVIV
jgi:hypothetical protein